MGNSLLELIVLLKSKEVYLFYLKRKLKDSEISVVVSSNFRSGLLFIMKTSIQR